MEHQAQTRGRAARSMFATALALALVATFTVSCGSKAELPRVSGYPQPGETPRRGGNVAYGLEAETADLCLAQATLDISGIEKAMAIYDTLTRPALQGQGADQKLVYAPYLAQSVDHNADYTVWTVKLRQGVKFQDGSELDAQVVKDNLDTYRGQGTNTAISALLLTFVFSDVKGIEVTDKYSLDITTKRPWVAFDAFLYSSGRLGMMAESQLENKQCNVTPVGTGPFQLNSIFANGWVPQGGCPSTAPGQFKREPANPKMPGAKSVPPPDCQAQLRQHGQPPDWKPFEELRVVRNANYWYIAPDGKPYPYLDSMEFRPASESTQKRYALQSGDLQIIHASGVNDFKAFEEYRKSGQANYVKTNAFGEITFLQINDSRPPMNDVRFRKAVQYGISRQDINIIINQGEETIADSPFAPGTPAHQDDTGWPKHDVKKARALLKEYLDSPEGKKAFPNGQIELTLSLTPDTGVIQLGQLLQAQAKELGITVKLDPIEQVQLIQRAISGDFDLMTFRNWPGGDPDLSFVWWYCNGSPSPDLIARIKAEGWVPPEDVNLDDYKAPSGVNPVNFAKYCDPRVDAALDQGRSEIDPQKRIDDYKQINKVFSQEGYWGLSWFTTWAVGFSPKLHDIYGPNLPGPDGQPSDLRPWNALVLGHQVTGMWLGK